MKWLLALICLLPTLYEVWGDRHGENKTGKKKDTLWLLVAILMVAGLAWWRFSANPIGTVLLIIGWRVMLFDYAVVYVLRKNGVIRADANVFTYTGKSTHWWDQAVAKINPHVRLLIRTVVFVGADIAYWTL